MLNITQLDYYYNGYDLNNSNLNHIHLSMSFDKNYILLSTISIATILNTSSIDTYIHFHIKYSYNYAHHNSILSPNFSNKQCPHYYVRTFFAKNEEKK